jgi:glyoxylase-like metal-dependent hydrolase (beta-lactamase superfamily II)
MSTFTSAHFQLHQLADGVFAAIHREGGAAQSNAGIIDLGDQVLVFDTFIAPAAAADLREAVAALRGASRPASALINSHYHNDHIWGNQAFPGDIPIISTIKTRELITTLGADEHRWFATNSQERLDALVTQLDQEKDEVSRRLTSYSITYYRTILEALPELQIRLPNITFADQMDFHGSRRLAHLICYGGGHTPSDSILYLPEERIIFMADLLFTGTHIYLPDGDPDEIRRTVSRIMQLPADILVPGHGQLGNAGDVEKMIRYIDRLETLVEEGMQKGMTDDDVAHLLMPDEYRDWTFPAFFPSNLKFLYELRSKGGVAAFPE